MKPRSTVNFNFNTWVKPGEIYEAARLKVEPKKYSVKIQAEKTDSKDSLFINIRGTKGETQKRKIGSNFKKQPKQKHTVFNAYYVMLNTFLFNP